MNSSLMRTSYKALASSSVDTTSLLDRLSSNDAIFVSTRIHLEEMSSSLNLSTTRSAAAPSLAFFSLPRVCSPPLRSSHPSTSSIPIQFSSSAVVRHRHLVVLSPFSPAFRAQFLHMDRSPVASIILPLSNSSTKACHFASGCILLQFSAKSLIILK